MRNKVVIASAGRSGSLWAAKVLRSAGVTCGHQAVFRHEHTFGKKWDWGDHEADSSFEAAPLLPKIKARKILLVRHPLKVIRSWVELGLFQDDMRDKYRLLSKVLEEYCPLVLRQESPIGRAAQYWVSWNRLALPHVNRIVQVESLWPDELCRIAGAKGQPCGVPRNTNHRTEDKVLRISVEWDDLTYPVRDKVFLLARELGYSK